MTKIRGARLTDAPKLAEMAVQFFADNEYWGERRELDYAHFLEHVNHLIHSPIAAVFVSVNQVDEITGAIAAIIMPDIFTGKLIAMKLHWVSVNGAGVELERMARQWAKMQGATAFKLSAISDKSATLIERLGYNRTEIIYSKAI